MVRLNVNGLSQSVETDGETPLLYILRNDFGLSGPTFGCGLGQCGACTVLIDEQAVRACITPAETAEGREVVTLEGLGTPAQPHPLQKAFIDYQALQCGYCTSGMIVSAAALLGRNPSPSEAEIRSALSGNLCRCAAHHRILAAIKHAAEEIADDPA